MSLPPTPVICDDPKKGEQQHKSGWFQFMKSVATFKGDLASLSAPPFLLSPESICQFSQYFNDHPSLLVAPSKEENAEKRALLVFHWFMSGLRRQMATRNDDGTRKKLKPLNPFLGEIFLGKWEDDCGTTELLSEQVSHHPPQTAYRIWNEKHGVSVEGHIGPRSFFSHTINIERRGFGTFRIDRYDEDHVFTMPKVHVEGIMTFQVAPELSGTSYIHSSSGYTTKIEYLSKGWVRGASHSFKATLFRDGAEKSPLYIAVGQWDGVYTVTNSKGTLVDTVDLDSLRRTPLQIKPVEKQHPLETGRAWQHVIDAINNNDIFAIGHEKSKIENAQRALRREEAREGRQWVRRYFTSVEEHPTVERLALRSKHEPCHDYRVYWKFDESKHNAIKENQLRGLKSPTHTRFDSGIGMLPDDVAIENS
ncbi:oxysterol-binding protein [Seiridium cupressi]